MTFLPGDAGSQPVRFTPRAAPPPPAPSQWRGFPSAAPPPPNPATSPPSHTDASTGGGDYGAARVNAYKQSPAYHQAIIDTFLHQPKPQFKAIVSGALQIPSLEGHTILNYLKSQGVNPLSVLKGGDAALLDKVGGSVLDPGKVVSGLTGLLGHGSSPIGQLGYQQRVDKAGATALKSAGAGINFLATPQRTPQEQLTARIGGPVPGDFGKSLVSTAQGLINKIPTSNSDPSHVVAASVGSPLPTAGGLVKNLAKGVVGYVPNTIQGTAGLVAHAAVGDWAGAEHAVIDPYKRFVKDPAGTFYNDPFNTAMLAGGIGGPLRGAGNLARRGAFGSAAAQAASTARAPLELGPHTGIYEARSYSPNPATKGVQVTREKAMRSVGRDPNVARQSVLPAGIANSLGIGLDAKLARIANEMSSMHGANSREGRGRGVSAIRETNPPKSVQDIVSKIQQRVIRTPETAITDINKEIARLQAVRPTLKAFDKVQNGRQIASLQAALKDPASIPAAFKAAGKTTDWFNARDQYIGERALIDPEAMTRSKLFAYAQAHMGAKYDWGGSPTREALAFREAAKAEQAAKRASSEAAGALTEAKRRGDVARVRSAQDAYKTAQAEYVSARSRRVELGVHAKATEGPRLVGGTGQELTNDAIKAHMDDHGVPEPAYVGEHPGKVGSRNFWMAYRGARGSKRGVRKTGEAFRKGAYDHSFEGLVAQAAKTEQIVTRAGLHDQIIKRLGIAKPEGMQNPHDPSENGMFKAGEAQRFIHDYSRDKNGDPIPGRPELVAITAGPARDMHAIKDVQSPSQMHDLDPLELKALEHATNDAYTRGQKDWPGKKETGPRNVILVPKAAMDAFKEQFAPGSKAGRRAGAFTQQFRRTVLPYSTHWMMQIGTEAALRGAIHGTYTPANLAMGHMLWKELRTTPEGQRALMEMVNGTFFNANDPLARVNPNPGAVSTFAHTTPVVKHIIWIHNRYADTIGHSMKFLETQARVSGLGKLAHAELMEHPIDGFTRAWQKSANLQGQVVAQLASRLTADPALVAKFGRSIDDTFGQYNKFGPTVRGMVQSVAPFLPWYLNAARFTFYLLPFKHPVASSLLASLRQTLEKDIHDGKQEPLSKFVADQLARFTPFGIVGPNVVDSFLTPFIPEFSGAYNVAHGLNVFGSGQLKGPNGTVTDPRQRALLAAYTVLESILPGLRLGRVALQHGGTAYGTSTIVNPQIKPGTGGDVGKVLSKMFNPVHGAMGAASSGFQPKGSGGSGDPFPQKSGSVDPFAGGGASSGADPFKGP